MMRPAPRILATLSLAAVLGTASVAGAATTSNGGGTAPGGGGGSFPGASGSVAAVTASSMEVQNARTGQVTVSWTTSTIFTQTVTATASSAAVGDCVTVSGASKKATITAKTVSVSPATTGKCSPGGFGGGQGGGGFRPPAGGTGRPSGGPPAGRRGQPPAGGQAAGARAGGSGNVGFASGKITAVTQKTMTISGFSSAGFVRPTGKSTKKPSTRPAAKATTVKVVLTSSTTYAEGQPATAADLAVGDCVSARGSSDSTGAVSASTVDITSTGAKSCATGFGGSGRGSSGG